MMKRFEEGTYKQHFTAFDGSFEYVIEKVTAKTVTVTVHKGKKNEKTGKGEDCRLRKKSICSFKLRQGFNNRIRRRKSLISRNALRSVHRGTVSRC